MPYATWKTDSSPVDQQEQKKSRHLSIAAQIFRESGFLILSLLFLLFHYALSLPSAPRLRPDRRPQSGDPHRKDSCFPYLRLKYFLPSFPKIISRRIRTGKRTDNRHQNINRLCKKIHKLPFPTLRHRVARFSCHFTTPCRKIPML